MRKIIAAAVTAAVLLPIGGCNNPNPRISGGVNEATTATGTGNTAGHQVAAGASANSESARERALQAPR